MSILGPDGAIAGNSFPTGGLLKKKPLTDIRLVTFPKMMVHPETKQMVMVPMQDFQYKREGSEEWFSMPMVETDKHDFNPEDGSDVG
jgi:hypothetical protein